MRHACLLLLPLAAIAFPEAAEAGYRRSWRGIGHGDDGPVPATLIRIVAWGLLIILIAAHWIMIPEHRAIA